MSTFDEFLFNTESELLIHAMPLRATIANCKSNIASVTDSHKGVVVGPNTQPEQSCWRALHQPSADSRRPIKYLWVEDLIEYPVNGGRACRTWGNFHYKWRKNSLTKVVLVELRESINDWHLTRVNFVCWGKSKIFLQWTQKRRIIGQDWMLTAKARRSKWKLFLRPFRADSSVHSRKKCFDNNCGLRHKETSGKGVENVNGKTIGKFVIVLQFKWY